VTELNAVTHLDDTNLTQAINYLEAHNLPVDLLLNFGSTKLEFKRTCNTKHRDNAGYVQKHATLPDKPEQLKTRIEHTDEK
jgi:hypothetical protein